MLWRLNEHWSALTLWQFWCVSILLSFGTILGNTISLVVSPAFIVSGLCVIHSVISTFLHHWCYEFSHLTSNVNAPSSIASSMLVPFVIDATSFDASISIDQHGCSGNFCALSHCHSMHHKCFLLSTRTMVSPPVLFHSLVFYCSTSSCMCPLVFQPPDQLQHRCPHF